MGTDLVNKILDHGHEPSLALSNTCHTNPVSKQYYQAQLSCIFSLRQLFLYIASKGNDDQLENILNINLKTPEINSNYSTPSNLQHAIGKNDKVIT